MVEARAVRKAVRVLAERKAEGVPFGARRVREPWGEVEREVLEVLEREVLLREGAEEMEEEPEVAEKAEGSTCVLLLLVETFEREGVKEPERDGESGVLFDVESWDAEDLRLRLLMLEVGDAFALHCRETVLMPLLVLVLAGMTIVTRPSGPGNISRLGWLMLHPADSSVPFE